MNIYLYFTNIYIIIYSDNITDNNMTDNIIIDNSNIDIDIITTVLNSSNKLITLTDIFNKYFNEQHILDNLYNITTSFILNQIDDNFSEQLFTEFVDKFENTDIQLFIKSWIKNWPKANRPLDEKKAILTSSNTRKNFFRDFLTAKKVSKYQS